MEMFIRLDTKGGWRGKEHTSSIQGQAGECVCFENPCICGAKESWENGISCYEFDKNNPADGLKNLLDYWTEIAMLQGAEDYKDMQITIFAGELVGDGADGEDTAVCEETIAEIDAMPIMENILEPYFDEKYGLIDEEKLEEMLNNIINIKE